jgi:hypothetical protein
VSDHLNLLLAFGMVFTLVCPRSSHCEAMAADSHTPDSTRLDSIEKTLPFLEGKVLSTLLFGGSAPVSITGEARLKGTYHQFNEYPEFLGPHPISEGSRDSTGQDRSALLPTGGVRLGMVVQPARNLALWSKLGFSSKFAGNRMRAMDTANGGFSLAQVHYYSANNPVAIFEDMAAGIAVMTEPVSFWVKTGAIIWTEASPLTIWKAEPRAFAWEYLEYEEEQPSSEYYKSNVSVGEKTGRAAWNKKAFNGINLESIKLPLDFYVDILYAKFPDYDPFEREYMDFSGDLGYASEELNPAIIQTGYGDSYRHTMHARIAKKFQDLTLGLNYNGITVSDDIIYAQGPSGIFFNGMFSLEKIGSRPVWATEYKYTDSSGKVLGTGSHVPSGYTGRYDSTALDCGKGFYKEPHAFSIDLKGNLSPHLSLQTDIGFSRTDTTWVWGDTVLTDRSVIPLTVKKRELTHSDFIPAIYTNIGFDSKAFNVSADLAYMKKGFYSPFSFVNPMDAFFAFGSNTVGEGTFSAKTEASPYCQNMTGIQLSVSPKLPGDGHLIVKYGQHLQPESGRDLLFFPYRLNGMDVTSCITSSYNLDGLGTVDYPMAGVKYNRRLGDESYDPQLDINGKDNSSGHLDEGPEKGGLHADYLSMYEAFVPYDDPAQVLLNINARRGQISRYRAVAAGTVLGKVIRDNGDTVELTNSSLATDQNGFVPMHRKYTGNLELDAAYDIGPLVHYKNKIYLAGYAAIEGISTALKALDVNENDNDILLWSTYLRFEPAIALTNQFYLDILVGFENWRSNKAWMNCAVGSDGKEDLDPLNVIIKRTPINYQDAAYGIGFDWDIFNRTSLHWRCKWLAHTDVGFQQNNYNAFLTSLEITAFF